MSSHDFVTVTGRKLHGGQGKGVVQLSFSLLSP